MLTRCRWIPTAALIVLAALAMVSCTDKTAQPWVIPTPDAQRTATSESPMDTVTSRTAAAPPLVPTQLPPPGPTVATAALSETPPTSVGPSVEALLPSIAPTTLVPSSQASTAAASDEPTRLEPTSFRSRLGVGVPRQVTDFTFDAILAQQLGMGWYLDWHIDPEPIQLDGLEYAQLYLMRQTGQSLQRDRIAQVLAANPGALWLAGNEPDVIWQDNKTPEEYARLYHEFYTFIKTLDPSAQVAIAGISQVTPLRLQYLEEVLAAYQRRYEQPMPVDVWNVHAFILREERDSWGVSIPPGFDVDQGMLWEIEDHANLDLFKQQIVDFRRWMVKHGQREKPLLVTEFGILMPEDYGFPPDAVRRFMIDTFDFMLNASDPEIGLSTDDNRLVQRFSWFSLAELAYPTGNLVDPQTGELTPLGQAFAEYAEELD